MPPIHTYANNRDAAYEDIAVSSEGICHAIKIMRNMVLRPNSSWNPTDESASDNLNPHYPQT